MPLKQFEKSAAWIDNQMEVFHSMNKSKKKRSKGHELPSEEMRIKDSEVFRSNSSKAWKIRRLVLTKDDILVGLAGQEKVIEKIPLVSINE
jgi:hypothetical protein